VLRVGCSFAPIPFAPELERALLRGARISCARRARSWVWPVNRREQHQWPLVAQHIPKVGLVMDEVKVVRWLKNVGDERLRASR